MTSITVDSMSYLYPGGKRVFHELNLSVTSGEFVVLVGPSGCGKSTLLRLLSGLSPVHRGRILFNAEDVTHVPARQRNVSMVFQNYALYPHLTVKKNLELSLRVAGVPRKERDERVSEVARYLEIEALLGRKPSALSGGQRQRVAMGRALVRRPALYLFDEPLSNLDAELRARLRVQMKRLHQAFPSTKVYVTHDQVEAMTLADRIVVLRDGVVQQTGSPDELYRSPANLFVAQFLGAPAINVVPLQQLSAFTPLPPWLAKGGTGSSGLGGLQLAIRPEQTVVGPRNPALERAVVEGHAVTGCAVVGGVVLVAENLGSVIHYSIETPCGVIRTATPAIRGTGAPLCRAGSMTVDDEFAEGSIGGGSGRVFNEGDAVFVAMPWDAALLFDGTTGLRVLVSDELH